MTQLEWPASPTRAKPRRVDLSRADCALIGLCGRAGAGKSAAGEYLDATYGFEPVAFSDALKDVLAELLLTRGADYAHLHEPALKQQPIPGFGGLTARHLMQSLGDWGRTLSPGFWIAQLAHRTGLHKGRAPVHDRIVVTDVRYPNEAEWITSRGGVVLRLLREGCSLSDPAHAAHSSEAHAPHLDAHVDLLNNGPTLYGLHALLDGAMADLNLERRPRDL